VLTCAQEESEGHTHGAECYEHVLTCAIPESEEHTHSEECYEDQLICTIPESEGHTHTESCYTEEKTLICSPHMHTDVCYSSWSILVCDKEEIELHTHQPSCYDQNGVLICDKLEVLEHQHTEECFRTETVMENDPQSTESDETNTETETETVTETEVAAETELSSDTLDPELIQSLNSAITEAAQEDSNLWNYLLTAMYGEDQESIEMLAEQFEVEPEIMQQYLQELGDAFNKMYDAMDEDEEGTLWEELMSAKEDEEQMSVLAERFGIDVKMLLLFIRCNMASYETETTANTSSRASEYNLTINGINYVAFSLNETKTQVNSNSYTKYANPTAATNDWIKSISASPWAQYSWPYTNNWLVWAISYCASYYNDATWIQTAKTTMTNQNYTGYDKNASDTKVAQEYLRQAIQKAIWFWTDDGNTLKNTMPQTTALEKLANTVKDASYNAANGFPTSFNWSWYAPSDTSTSPYLLVAPTGANISSSYVGFQAGKIHSTATTKNPQFALYIMPYADYVSATSEAERIEKAEIAYCFDHPLHWPSNTTDGRWRVGYDEYYLANHYQLYEESTNDADFKSDKDTIMAIALNGYPHNVSGFYDGSIGEEAYRLVTQWAIWHYTDGDDLPAYYNDDEKTLYKKLIGEKDGNGNETPSNYDYLGVTLNNLKALADSTDAETAESYINVYMSLGQAYNTATQKFVTADSDDSAYVSDHGFQNLLVVGYRSDAINPYVPTPTPTPTPSTYSFTVNKTVIGGSDDDEFDFTFRLYLNGQVASTDYTFSLKNGGTYSLNLPSGYSGLTYEVIENSAEGYTASATSDQGDKGTKNTDGSYTITGAVNRDITVEFVNTKSGPTATPTPSPIPTPENYRVIVRKTVKDASGNSTGTDTTKFNFKIRFYKGSGDGVAYSNLEMSEADGVTKYYTRSSADYTGYTFEIIETAADGYTTTGSSTREGYTAGQDADGNYKITGTIGGTDSNIYVDFVNTKEPDTYNLTLGKEVIVENTEIDTSQEFTFKVKLTDYNNKSESGDTYAALSGPFDVTYSKTDESAEDVPTTQSLPFTNGEQEITLKHGQTITISGLPAGYNFTVSEASDILTDYTPRIQLDGETVTDQDGNDVFSGFSYYNANEDHTLIFNNTRIETTHTLTLSKEVKTDKSEINTDEDFTFTIKLYDSKKAVLTQKFKATYGTLSGVTNAKAPETTETELDFSSGETTVTLKHGQTITIEGLPNIYGYTISETPSGYTPTVKVDGVQMKNSQGTETLNRFSYYSVSKDTTVAYTNKKIEYHLTLEKTVEGRFADKNKAFTFNIELKEGTAALTGKVKVTSSAEDGVEAPTYTELTFDKDGKASVSLKHGQKITLEGLPYNYDCKITEDSTVAAGYQIKSSFEDTEGTDTLTSGQIISVGGYEAAKISFVNTKSELVTTGLRLDVMPYIIGACIVAAFAAFLLAGRRRHK
jgi:TQXA domain-containing protein